MFANRMAVSGKDLITHDYNGISFRSEDWGATWTPMGLPGAKVRASAGNEKAFFATLSTDGLHRSLDGGRTWTRIFHPNGGSFPGAQALGVYGDTVLVTDYKYLYRSFDGGTTWSSDTGLAPAPSDHQMFFDGRHLVAWDTRQGLRLLRPGRDLDRPSRHPEARGRSSPSGFGGFHQRASVPGLPPPFSGPTMAGNPGRPRPRHLDIDPGGHPGRPGGRHEDGDPKGVFLSSDGGETWMPHNQGLATKRVSLFLLSQGTLVMRTSRGGFYAADIQGVTGIRPESRPSLRAVPKGACEGGCIGTADEGVAVTPALPALSRPLS